MVGIDRDDEVAVGPLERVVEVSRPCLGVPEERVNERTP
jgi:hypothetical protein